MDKIILGTQIVTVIGFVAVAFWLYKLLVEQKDATIKLLQERIADRDTKLAELQARTPDELVKALGSRVDLSLKEIERLRADGAVDRQQINVKEAELNLLRERLQALSALIVDSDLVCPTCSAPLLTRKSHTVYGNVGGKEVEAEVEYREYQCGYAIDEEQGDLSPCRAIVHARA